MFREKLRWQQKWISFPDVTNLGKSIAEIHDEKCNDKDKFQNDLIYNLNNQILGGDYKQISIHSCFVLVL